MTAVGTKISLDVKGADAAIRAAEEHALAHGHRVVIAVVDAWGHVLQLRRTEGAQIASDQVAIDKARTAAIFIRPSREIEEQVSGGRLGALALHGAVALTGGVPLRVDGKVVGAIGTSGETPDEDEAVSIAGAAAEFSTVEHPALTYDGARLVAETVGAAARARGVAPVVSVVDAGGELVYLWRPDEAQVASVKVTTDKARTAAIYRRPSRDFEEQAAHGRPSALHLAGAVPLQGGMPIQHDGHVIGAVGVSGASSADEDQELATIGAAALGSGEAEATFIPRENVDAMFRTGGLLVDTPHYKVDAGRRTAPGDVEYHAHVTDIMRVVAGRATVVTGGEMRDTRETGPGEIRARAVDGGVTHELAEGDVLVVPAGVPHQFVAVSDPFLYFVTKVTAATLPGPPELLPGRPDAVIDLQNDEGTGLVGGHWRYSDATIKEIDFVDVGPDLGPSGAPARTYDVVPHAEAVDHDDSGWPILPPGDTQLRLGHGRVSFNWYRIAVTIPERVGDFDPTGTTVVFEVVVDDYAEIWVDGQLPLALGLAGGQVVGGFNAPNRVVLTRDARPGQQFQIAVFGINGPVSASPRNYIWMRSATLDFYTADRARVTRDVPTSLLRVDPAIDAIVPADARLEQVAGGFEFTEGPVWSRDGALLFSSPNTNVIYRWSPHTGTVTVFRSKSGYAGVDIGQFTQPGSNGLTFDPDGRLAICQHGNRRIIRVNPHGDITVVADRYQGRRLNSPNDLVYRSDGTLYLTDPPFGLPESFDDPKKELPFSGVYRVRDGETVLLTDELSGPNGLAFSPDERHLYVGNWDPDHKVVMRYEVDQSGDLSHGTVFFDMTGAPGDDAVDGLKVDRAGNLYVCGPGGLWVLSPDGRHLGTLRLPESPHNLAWGDSDGRTLYITALTGVYRIRLTIPGIRPQ